MDITQSKPWDFRSTSPMPAALQEDSDDDSTSSVLTNDSVRAEHHASTPAVVPAWANAMDVHDAVTALVQRGGNAAEVSSLLHAASSVHVTAAWMVQVAIQAANPVALGECLALCAEGDVNVASCLHGAAASRDRNASADTVMQLLLHVERSGGDLQDAVVKAVRSACAYGNEAVVQRILEHVPRFPKALEAMQVALQAGSILCAQLLEPYVAVDPTAPAAQATPNVLAMRAMVNDNPAMLSWAIHRAPAGPVHVASLPAQACIMDAPACLRDLLGLPHVASAPPTSDMEWMYPRGGQQGPTIATRATPESAPGAAGSPVVTAEAYASMFEACCTGRTEGICLRVLLQEVPRPPTVDTSHLVQRALTTPGVGSRDSGIALLQHCSKDAALGSLLVQYTLRAPYTLDFAKEAWPAVHACVVSAGSTWVPTGAANAALEQMVGPAVNHAACFMLLHLLSLQGSAVVDLEQLQGQWAIVQAQVRAHATQFPLAPQRTAVAMWAAEGAIARTAGVPPDALLRIMREYLPQEELERGAPLPQKQHPTRRMHRGAT